MSALGARLTGLQRPDAKFTCTGKQVRDPFGNHFADARDNTAAEAITAALNAPVFFAGWIEREQR